MKIIGNFTVEPNREHVRLCWGQQDVGPDPSLRKHQTVAVNDVENEWLKDNDENKIVFDEVANVYDMNFEGTGDGV
jgi:hypothetical protein